uniref:Uncharacterized protein n=1 Tax=Suricata suricatta TaxID=37032 RepID=A0A673UXI7_SURSU
MPSPLSREMACISTSLPLLARLVLNLILALVGRLETISFRCSSEASPKFRTTRKTVSMPSSSLVYTTEWLLLLRRQNQPLLRSSSWA